MFDALIILGYAALPPSFTSTPAICLGVAAIKVVFDASVDFWAALEPVHATICARSTLISWPEVDLGSATPVVVEALEVSSTMVFIFIVVVFHVEEMLDLQSPDLTPVLRGSELDALAVCPIPAPLLAVLQAA